MMSCQVDSRGFLVFLGFQLLEECFEQPRMTGWRDDSCLAHIVDALDERTGQPELDKLAPDSLPFLMFRSISVLCFGKARCFDSVSISLLRHCDQRKKRRDQTVPRGETETPLFVDTNAVMSSALTLQRFEAAFTHASQSSNVKLSTRSNSLTLCVIKIRERATACPAINTS